MRSQKTLLDFHQELLDKISLADARVFRKELRKAFRRLLPEEREQLKQWFRSACVCKLPQGDHITVPVHRS
jgi:hypothetical protein